MVECKTKMMVSPQINNSKLRVSIPDTSTFKPITNASPVSASDSACAAYEQYLRFPEIASFWSQREFPTWRNELLLRPCFMALEFSFHLISTVLRDRRTYSNVAQWIRRLEALVASQIRIISEIVEAEDVDSAPTIDMRSAGGVVPGREGSHAEVWKAAEGVVTVVSSESEESLLPRLAAWRKSEKVAQRVMISIEFYMARCPYTLGLGEPNLTGKPKLNYDAVCRPGELVRLVKSRPRNNVENQTVYSVMQILECWINAGKEILSAFVVDKIESKGYKEASDGCYLVEQVWKLLMEINDLLLLADPDDFLRLKTQLLANPEDTAALCFRSRGLVELTKSCKDLRQKVPEILGVEVDPRGGPRVQEAAMKLYVSGKREEGEGERIHLLQGLQSLEKGMKGFYYGYKQLMVVLFGSLDANGNKAVSVGLSEEGDALAQMFLQPTYFPSLDAAKTFVGDSWRKDSGSSNVRRARISK